MLSEKDTQGFSSQCCEDYPQLLGAVRQNFAKIKDEFLKSYEHRAGKLSALEEAERQCTHSGVQAGTAWRNTNE